MNKKNYSNIFLVILISFFLLTSAFIFISYKQFEASLIKDFQQISKFFYPKVTKKEKLPLPFYLMSLAGIPSNRQVEYVRELAEYAESLTQRNDLELLLRDFEDLRNDPRYREAFKKGNKEEMLSIARRHLSEETKKLLLEGVIKDVERINSRYKKQGRLEQLNSWLITRGLFTNVNAQEPPTFELPPGFLGGKERKCREITLPDGTKFLQCEGKGKDLPGSPFPGGGIIFGPLPDNPLRIDYGNAPGDGVAGTIGPNNSHYERRLLLSPQKVQARTATSDLNWGVGLKAININDPFNPGLGIVIGVGSDDDGWGCYVSYHPGIGWYGGCTIRF
jgi:hypothetical protein